MSIKTRKNQNYKELIPRIANVFEKLGYHRLHEYAKPYYLNYNEGYVYRVIDSNKLKQMHDGAKPNKYGHLKLKCKDGTTEDVYTHQLIMRYGEIPNIKKKTLGHHIDGNVSHNGRKNVLPMDGKEHHKAHWIFTHNPDEYSEFIEIVRKDNCGSK